MPTLLHPLKRQNEDGKEFEFEQLTLSSGRTTPPPLPLPTVNDNEAKATTGADNKQPEQLLSVGDPDLPSATPTPPHGGTPNVNSSVAPDAKAYALGYCNVHLLPLANDGGWVDLAGNWCYRDYTYFDPCGLFHNADGSLYTHGQYYVPPPGVAYPKGAFRCPV